MKSKVYRKRRSISLSALTAIIAGLLLWQGFEQQNRNISVDNNSKIAVSDNGDQELATAALIKIEIKGRAPKTGYVRSEFGNGWASWKDCDTRQRILARDLTNIKLGDDGCTVLTGNLNDIK